MIYENIREALKVFGLLILAGFKMSQRVSTPLIERFKRHSKTYIRTLAVTFICFSLVPPILLGLGRALDWTWLEIGAVIVGGSLLLILLLIAAPIGLLVASLPNAALGRLQSYFRFSQAVLISFLLLSLAQVLFLHWTSMRLGLIFLISLVLLIILKSWLIQRRTLVVISTILIVGTVLVQIFPKRTQDLVLDLRAVDSAPPKPITITAADLDSGYFRFFDDDGNARIWFFRNEDGSFEFFDRQGNHGMTSDPLRPVKPTDVPQIKNYLNSLVPAKPPLSEPRVDRTKSPPTPTPQIALGQKADTPPKPSDLSNQIAALQKELLLDPNNADGQLQLGQLYEQAGNSGEALEAYQKAIAINPTLSAAKERINALPSR